MITCSKKKLKNCTTNFFWVEKREPRIMLKNFHATGTKIRIISPLCDILCHSRIRQYSQLSLKRTPFNQQLLLELCPMSSDFQLWPLFFIRSITWYSAMFNSLHSHVLHHSVFFFTAKHNVLKFSFQILTRRGILFFFNSVVALRINSRLSPWRSQRFHFKEEALTASVRRSYATFMADTTCSGWQTGQHPSWPWPG